MLSDFDYPITATKVITIRRITVFPSHYLDYSKLNEQFKSILNSYLKLFINGITLFFAL